MSTSYGPWRDERDAAQDAYEERRADRERARQKEEAAAHEKWVEAAKVEMRRIEACLAVPDCVGQASMLVRWGDVLSHRPVIDLEVWSETFRRPLLRQRAECGMTMRQLLDRGPQWLREHLAEWLPRVAGVVWTGMDRLDEITPNGFVDVTADVYVRSTWTEWTPQARLRIGPLNRGLNYRESLALPEDSAQAELADLPAGTREERFVPLCLCAAGWDEPLQDQAPWGLVKTKLTARELELRGHDWIKDPLNLAEWLGLEGRVREVILHNLLGKYVRVVVRDPR